MTEQPSQGGFWSDVGQAMQAMARSVDADAIEQAADLLGRDLAARQERFRFDEFVRTSRIRTPLAREAAVEVFRRVAEKAWSDDALTESEAAQLDRIASLLDLELRRRDRVLDDVALDAMRRREGLPPIGRNGGAAASRLLERAKGFLGRLRAAGREAGAAARSGAVRAGEALETWRDRATAAASDVAQHTAGPSSDPAPAAIQPERRPRGGPVSSPIVSLRPPTQPSYQPPRTFAEYRGQLAVVHRVRPSYRQLWLARSLGADLSRLDRTRVTARLAHMLHAADPTQRMATLKAQCRLAGAPDDAGTVAELWEGLAARLEDIEFADERDILDLHSYGLVPERAFSPAEADAIRHEAQRFEVECPNCRQAFPRLNQSCPACGWAAYKAPIIVHLPEPDPLFGVRWWEAKA